MYRICLVLLLCLLSSCLGSSSALDCNPCIQRKDFKLKAIVHGTSEDDFWLQVQAAMGQAADDMGLVLDLTLRREYDAEEMAQELTDAAQSGDFQALIVTIPDSTIQAAVTAVISEDSIPVFGFNQGFEVAREIGILGFAAQDELVAGQAAAEEFIRIRTEASSPITRALFVDNKVGDSGMLLRFQGFRETLAEYSQNSTDSTDIQVDLLLVDPENQFQHVTDIQGAFEGCSYDIILLGSVDSLEIAVAADESQGCLERTTLGSFDETVEIIKNIVLGKLAFGVSQQTYLQGAMPVFFAALYATTGKALALPADERVYLAGPTIINKDNVPTDTQQQCSTDAFPVCPNILAPDGSPATCECADRTKIRIGGVLHGVTTDAFWDPVFAASEQAAKDFEVDLDLIRFEPQDTPEEVYQQMTARIKTLCEAGVDGIFLTIPSDAVVPAVQRCQELNVPVVSVNSGGDTSVALGLLNHIGMLEYSAGFGAGERMIAAGMKRGFCTNHEPGNTATIIRCQAFADAIAAHNSKDGSDLVEYGGELPVPLDNQVEYALILEGAIGSDDDWDGQGIIFVGPAQIPSYRATLVEKHPAAVVGTFDVGSEVQNGLESGLLQFGVDQQPYLQGYIPIILLTLEAYTKQSLKNFFIESGPNFVDTPASEDAKVCEANFFEVCPDRPAEEFNFISSGLTVFGYCLFTLLLLGVLICGAWTFYYRNKWVVKISQPLFLYIMLFGMLLSTLSIPFLGVETEYRFLQDDSTGKLTDIPNEEIGLVDASCMLVPWFYGLGFAVTFSAIFAKIQRVKLIYLAGINMQRKKVTIRDVSNIFLVIFGTELSLLVAWQAASPYKWQREVTEEEDDFPVESVGACESKSGSYFLIGIFLFHVICLIYALILSYQTKDINNEYAESSYLFLTVMFMFQVRLFGSTFSVASSN